MTPTPEEIEARRRELAHVIEQARREKKFCFHPYQSVWFTPDELEAEHAKGRYLWDGWIARDPEEKVDREVLEIMEALKELNHFRRKIKAYREKST